MANIIVPVPDGKMCGNCEQWYSCDALGRKWRCPHRKGTVKHYRLDLARKIKACLQAHVKEETDEIYS